MYFLSNKCSLDKDKKTCIDTLSKGEKIVMFLFYLLIIFLNPISQQDIYIFYEVANSNEFVQLAHTNW